MAMTEHWIAKATSKNKGKFKAKAQRAGMSTLAYANKEADVKGTLGKEAREARTLINMRK